MKYSALLSLFSFLIAPLAWAGASEDIPGEPSVTAETIRKGGVVKVLLVGDSTVANYPKDNPNSGWGQMFPQFFGDKVSFRNAARGGRSSKSFLDRGEWESAMQFKPDFVFIQFGHNDQPSKGPERATDPETTYRANLRRYIADARAAGAQPVLVTSVARRSFRDGKAISNLWPWVDAMKAVGQEEAVPVIDLHGLSFALFDRLGDADSFYITNGVDRTHFSEEGATVIAGLVVGQLPEQVPALASFLKKK